MAEYTKVFNNPYPQGWKDSPNESTPITANALQEHTDAIENLEQYLYDNPIGGGGGSTVEVNPLLSEGKHIADITVDGITSEIYAPEGGSGGTDFVEITKAEYDALPADKLTDGIPRLITDYAESGGGGGGSNIIDVLFETSTYSDNITLSNSYENYDFIVIEGYANSSGDTYLHTSIYDTKQLAIGNNIGLNNDAKYTWYNIDSTTNFSKVAGGDIKCNKVLGIKTSSGGGSGAVSRAYDYSTETIDYVVGTYKGKNIYRHYYNVASGMTIGTSKTSIKSKVTTEFYNSIAVPIRGYALRETRPYGTDLVIWKDTSNNELYAYAGYATSAEGLTDFWIDYTKMGE